MELVLRSIGFMIIELTVLVVLAEIIAGQYIISISSWVSFRT